MTEDLTPGVRPTATDPPTDADEPEPEAEPPTDEPPATEATDEPEGEPPTAEASADEPEATADAPPLGRIELYLLRHADAGDPMTWRGPDEDRPLSARGHKQSKRLGDFLAKVGFKPDAILTSPKLRAVQTAKLVAKPLKAKVQTNDRLAFGVSLAELDRVLDDVPQARRVVVVGHDPDFSEVLSLLTGSQLGMAKGAIARIDVERPLRLDGGELRWLVPPALLKA